MKDKQYIIFDLDGTLVNSFTTVVNACKKVFASYASNSMPDDNFFNTFQNKNMEQMFMELAMKANLSPETFRKKYDEQYALDCVNGSTIIDKQYEILKRARYNGIGIIIITNKKQEIACEVCEQLFGHHIIDIIIGRNDTQPIKPRHVIIDRLHNLGIDPQKQCLKYYGDSNSDYETAKLLKIEFINTKNE